ncbi:MAG: cryptochrome/photolyase family protein [Acidimicrobiales bacterium]
MVDNGGPDKTVWILADQLNRNIASLAHFQPGDCRVLFVESRTKLTSKRWHVQRAHMVISAMRHFAAELAAEGFDVDYRHAPTLSQGVRDHCDQHGIDRVIAMEPMSWDGRRLMEQLGIDIVRNDQFTCHHEDFAEWADGRKSFKMEDFYRWQRQRLGLLMDGDDPIGGQWNFDHDNREPPPGDGRSWPEVSRFELDEIDTRVLDDLGDLDTWGAKPHGLWPVTRAQALQRLDEFVEHGLGPFGPHEDAMLAAEWKLAHSTLSSSLNLGLLHPDEVARAAEAAYFDGRAPINSVEGFIRQVIGWREYVWGVYWLWMPNYRDMNHLEATRPIPPAFTGASTEMACVRGVVDHVHHNGWAHHIERLMVLGNLALTSGVDPQAMVDWMWAGFVDGAEWVMLPNVVGMALHADGGMMATKPYASGGAYINKMSDYCRGCRFDPKKRVGDDACPFTTLYWDFIARHAERLGQNHRMARQVAGMRRLSDLDQVRGRAAEVLSKLDAGTL